MLINYKRAAMGFRFIILSDHEEKMIELTAQNPRSMLWSKK